MQTALYCVPILNIDGVCKQEELFENRMFWFFLVSNVRCVLHTSFVAPIITSL